jgi:hypothetical protein
MRSRLLPILFSGSAPADTTAPTLTITALSAVANVAAMQIVASEEVTGFEVGDITISAGGSLASFATADNIVFTVSWTLAAGTNTMDIAGAVCTDIAGNANEAATQYVMVYTTIQPDGTAGLDTVLYQPTPNTNYGNLTGSSIGDQGGAVNRWLIKFDLSGVAAGSTIYSSILSLYCLTDGSSNARAFRIYRQKRAWVETQATWNNYITGNAWQTAGAFGANDCEQTDIGSRNMTATETINQFKSWTLTASAIQEMITGGSWTNNGFLIKADTETLDAYEFASSENATAGNRPKLELVYHPNP